MRLAELKQKVMTHMINRTFRKQPGLIDRLIIKMIASAAGPQLPDPELKHPELKHPELKHPEQRSPGDSHD